MVVERIMPFGSYKHIVLAAIRVGVLGLSRVPILVVPRAAVRPGPRALTGRVRAADPAPSYRTECVNFRILGGAVDRREVVMVRAAVLSRVRPGQLLVDVHEGRRAYTARLQQNNYPDAAGASRKGHLYLVTGPLQWRRASQH